MRIAVACSLVCLTLSCSGGGALLGDDDVPDGDAADAEVPFDGIEADAEVPADGPGDAADMADEASPPACGNGVLEWGEECDDGPRNDDARPDACRRSCTAPACGDGVVDRGERCDDGNRSDLDDCPASCFPRDDSPVVLEGDAVPVSTVLDVSGDPFIAWNGDEWGVVWGLPRENSRFARLDADGVLRGTPRVLPLPFPMSGLAWYDGTYAATFFSAGSPAWEGGVVLLDAEGTVRTGPVWPPEVGGGIGAAWAPLLAAWVLAYSTYEAGGDGTTTVMAVKMTGIGGFPEPPVPVSVPVSAEGEMHRPPLVITSAAGSLVVWREEGTTLRYRAPPWTGTVAAPARTPPGGTLERLRGQAGAGYGTDFLLAWHGDVPHVARWVRLDGWTLEPRGETVDWASAVEEMSMAAAPARGYVGVCWLDGPEAGMGSRVWFRLLRPDGETLGPPVLVSGERLTARGCTIGWSGTEFVVGYLGRFDPDPLQVFAQRVRPLI